MPYKILSPQQVPALLENPDVVVLDMRDGNSYVAGHIPGAIQATEEHVIKVAEETPANTPVLVYCYHGISSRQLAQFLASQGLEQVHSLEGGWGAWSPHNPA